MNIAVRYFSRSGNTQKVAEAIAKSVHVKAENCSSGIAAPVDILFLGGSIFANGIDKGLKNYIAQLDPVNIKCVAVFGTSALKKAPDKEIEKLVRDKGIKVMEQGFHCRGSFTLLHKGHPDRVDLKKAAEFAQSVIALLEARSSKK